MLGDDAKRPPAPQPPPLPGAAGYNPHVARPLLDRWFAACKIVEADVARYAVGFVAEHFAKAGKQLDPCFAASDTWFFFLLNLRISLEPLLPCGPHPDWIRELFADLFEYARLNPSFSLAALLLEANLLDADFAYLPREQVAAQFALVHELAAEREQASWGRGSW